MKKYFFGICCLFLGVLGFSMFSPTKPGHIEKTKPPSISITPTHGVVSIVNQTLFVPYWTLSQETIATDTYDRVVYFGITANTQGINVQEDGYKDLSQFLRNTSSARTRLLTIRMLNTDTNTAILADVSMQQKIIQQSISIAKDKGFDGIVLDFEISALGFDKITKSITSFENVFADSVHQKHLQFYTTMYGDTFVRFRPFDVKQIASHADGIFVMAYDFHKANGNPGPNFPFTDTQSDGYDFTAMIHDFAQEVPKDKVTIIYGFFGYDWSIDDKGNSTSQANSLSLNQITRQFLTSCKLLQCKMTSNPTTKEKNVTYIDTTHVHHMVWFEDQESASIKTTFLKAHGIGSIGYWAYSYF